MTTSSRDMRYRLNLSTVVLNDTNKLSAEQDSSTRSFTEALCMDPYDLANGYHHRKQIKQQAVRNHTRLLASILITTLRRNISGFTPDETFTISWKEQKHKQPWKKFGIKRGNQTIQRLDWFLHKLIMQEGSNSILQWLDLPCDWAIIEYTDDGDISDLEYDPDQKQPSRTVNKSNKNDQRKEKHEKHCNLLWKSCNIRTAEPSGRTRIHQPQIPFSAVQSKNFAQTNGEVE